MFKFLFPFLTANVIRQSSVIRGDVKFNGSVKIRGLLEGSLVVAPTNCIFVARKGVLRSDNLNMDTLVVEGAVYAKHIKVRHLVVRKGGEVHGRIETQSLTIDPSGRYDGHVTLCPPPVAISENASATVAKERLETVLRT